MLLIFQTSYSQMVDDPVELDEIVLSLPFSQDLGKSVIKVNKINFQNINPIAIVTLAPLFSILWLKLDKRKLNPRTPIKFAMAMFIGAVAFYIMSLAFDLAQEGQMVSPMWLVVVYVLLTIGELMLSPIGLSMVTKLSPGKITSVMMGIWMASFALGNYFDNFFIFVSYYK